MVSDPDLISNEEIELQLLLESIYLKYGYDFRGYSKSHLKRRLISRLNRSGLNSVSEMIHQVLYNTDFFHQILTDLSVNVTEMFRDPEFYKVIRTEVIPVLKTYPFIKIWHAGCATGEEVYSMAIVLKEEGLFERSTLYATDFNQIALAKASEGIYPLDKMKLYTENYYKSEGKASFCDYFTVNYGSAIFEKELKKNVIFSDHNLVTDGVFGEMNMIICRNVLIYFNPKLQNHVHKLFFDSLLPGGFVCLGSKESLLLSDHQEYYTQIDKQAIYKKNYFHSFD